MLRLENSIHPCINDFAAATPSAWKGTSACKGDGRFRLRIDQGATDTPASAGYHHSAAQHGVLVLSMSALSKPEWPATPWKGGPRPLSYEDCIRLRRRGSVRRSSDERQQSQVTSMYCYEHVSIGSRAPMMYPRARRVSFAAVQPHSGEVNATCFIGTIRGRLKIQDPGVETYTVKKCHQCSPPWPRICRCLAPKKKKVEKKKKGFTSQREKRHSSNVTWSSIHQGFPGKARCPQWRDQPTRWPKSRQSRLACAKTVCAIQPRASPSPMALC